jgi:S-formylglutathione hydrolase FrmB
MLVTLYGLVVGWPWLGFAQESANISPARKDEHRFLVHTVQSPYQSEPTTIKVLLPNRILPGQRYLVLYVLPVDRLEEEVPRWGNALLEVKKNDLHNKHGLICVWPTFSQLPWYGDHPTDPLVRQESHFVNVVVPFMEREYPALAKRDARLLLGFSKSGWGAFSLLLRHPELFGKAAAWDAPLMMDEPRRSNIKIFGSAENFREYQISALLRKQSSKLKSTNRLIHFGYSSYRADHESAHNLMHELGIPHRYRDGPRRKHCWNSGWLPEAVEMLLEEGRSARPQGVDDPQQGRGKCRR